MTQRDLSGSERYEDAGKRFKIENKGKRSRISNITDSKEIQYRDFVGCVFGELHFD